MRDPAAKAFHKPQREHKKDMSGVSLEGRINARALRLLLREMLERRPTAKEYRAAKRQRVFEAYIESMGGKR